MVSINLPITLTLLTLVIGLWVGAKYNDNPFIRFFGRNDWFVALFLILVGYANYVAYPVAYIKNMSLVLIIFGLLLLLAVVFNLSKK